MVATWTRNLCVLTHLSTVTSRSASPRHNKELHESHIYLRTKPIKAIAEYATGRNTVDAYVLQQTGRDVVSDSSHTTPHHTQSQSYTLNEQEPSFNEEVSNLDHQIER